MHFYLFLSSTASQQLNSTVVATDNSFENKRDLNFSFAFWAFFFGKQYENAHKRVWRSEVFSFCETSTIKLPLSLSYHLKIARKLACVYGEKMAQIASPTIYALPKCRWKKTSESEARKKMKSYYYCIVFIKNRVEKREFHFLFQLLYFVVFNWRKIFNCYNAVKKKGRFGRGWWSLSGTEGESFYSE